MDTRGKIVPLSALTDRLAQHDWVAIAGFFDPLTAEQAARVSALKKRGSKLLGIVLEDENELLSVNARAALVAALRDIDLVAIAKDGEWRNMLVGVRVEVEEDLESERARTNAFIQLVWRRRIT